MQEESGRRALFTKNQPSITPSDVANQVIRTGNAEINQIERETKQSTKDVDTIVNSTLGLYKTGQSISTELNRRSLQSAQTELTKNTIEYENQVMSGGLIDRENIPFEQKMLKKQEAYNALQLSVKQNKEILEGRKGLFQKILGTEDAYNSSLAEFDTKSQKALNLADRNLTNEARQAEIEFSIQNTTDIIKSINNANSTKQVNLIAGTANESINELERNGYITKGQAQKFRSNVSQVSNDRNVDVFLNNIQDRLYRGDNPIELLNQVKNIYEGTRDGKVFNESYGGYEAISQQNRVGNETKIRDFYNGLQKQIIDMESKGIIYNLPYNVSTDEALSQVPQVGKSDALKAIQSRNDPTNADFEANKLTLQRNRGQINPTINPNDPRVISSFQIENGVGYKSSFTTQNAKIFKTGAEEIGIPRNKIVNGEALPVSNVEQYRDWYSSQYLKLGGTGQIEKESSYHLPKEMHLLNKALGSGRKLEEFADVIDKVIVAKNLGKFAVKEDDKLDKDALSDYLKTDEGKFLESTGQLAEAQSRAKAYRNISEGIGESNIRKTAERFAGDNDYILTNQKIVEFDRTQYSKSQIEGGINAVFANSKQYLNLQNKFNVSTDDIIKAETTQRGIVDFYVYPANGNPKFSIGSYAFENLPKPLTSQEQAMIDEKNLNLKLAKQELESRKDWDNIKENLSSPQYYIEKIKELNDKAEISKTKKSQRESDERGRLIDTVLPEAKERTLKLVDKGKGIISKVRNSGNQKNPIYKTRKASNEELERIIEENK